MPWSAVRDRAWHRTGTDATLDVVIEPGTVPTFLASQAMGTRFEFVLPVCSRLADRDLRAAGEAALAVIDDCDARYSLFRSDSLLARINRGAFERPVKVDDDMFELLAACAELRDATEGSNKRSEI